MRQTGSRNAAYIWCLFDAEKSNDWSTPQLLLVLIDNFELLSKTAAAVTTSPASANTARRGLSTWQRHATRHLGVVPSLSFYRQYRLIVYRTNISLINIRRPPKPRRTTKCHNSQRHDQQTVLCSILNACIWNTYLKYIDAFCISNTTLTVYFVFVIEINLDCILYSKYCCQNIKYIVRTHRMWAGYITWD